MTWMRIAAVNGLIAVAAGAFGAHALKTSLAADMLANFDTAARYQMYHALALLGVAGLAAKHPSRCATLSGLSFVVGILLFSGSLYAYSLGGPKMLVMLTPFGGGALMLGWLLMLLCATRRRVV